jgi:putative Ig domain-containing protein
LRFDIKVIVFILLIFSIPSFASTAWQSSPSSHALMNDDGTFYATGISSDGNLLFLKQDPFGNTIWAKKYTGATGYVRQMKRTAEGDFVIFMISTEYPQFPMIFKVHPDGTILFQKKYTVGTQIEAFTIDLTSDGGLVLSGESSAGWCLLKLDENGNVIWVRSYSGGQSENQVRQMSDGSYLLVGSGPPESRYFLAYRLSSTGNFLWQKKYEFSNGNWFDSMDIFPNGDAVFEGESFEKKFALLRINNNGEALWQKEFDDSYSHTYGHLSTASDNGLFLGTIIYDADPLLISGTKFDAQGSVLWHKTYAFTPDLDSILESPDDGFFVRTQNLIKTDSEGNALTCSVDLPVVETVPPINVIDTSYSTGIISAQTSDLSVVTENYQIDTQHSCVCGNLNFNTYALSNAVLGQSYSFTIEALGANQPFTFDLVFGDLPDGLTLNSNGLISGIPTVRGSYDFTIRVTDTQQCFTTKHFSLKVLPVCLFCDDFNDGFPGFWDYETGTWLESNGNLSGISARKARAVVKPSAFNGCTICSFEAYVETAGGFGNQLRFLTWYADKTTTVEVILKEEYDRWIIKQRVNKTVIAKAKVIREILPNQLYTVNISFDGTKFHLIVNGQEILTLISASGSTPFGRAGFFVKATTGTFDELVVY